MERAQQLINNDGLQIPLPFMVQYGLHPGSEVIVELDDDVIRIVPKLPDQTDIENRALRLLLKSVGDAVLVKAQQLDAAEGGRKIGDWRVVVCARGVDDPLGHLDYTKRGQLLSDLSMVLDTIRQKASTLAKAA